MNPRFRLLGIAVLCLAGMSGAAAALLWRHAAPPVELATGTYLSPARSVPDFSLIDQRGAPFGRKNLEGHWSMLFLGYTNCPEFCPATLAMLATLEKQLRASGAAARPEVIFLSVDAKRDTPAQLARFVPYFDPEFIGITGKDQSSVETVARQLGADVSLDPPRPDGSYAVNHSAEIFVLDPKGRIAAILTGPFSVDSLQADFKRILNAAA